MDNPRGWPDDSEIDYSDEVLPGTDTRPAKALSVARVNRTCGCGDPQRSAVYLDGVIGRGSDRTGTQTEELSEFRCSRHAVGRRLYGIQLRKVVDEDTAIYGPWQVLQWHSHKLKHESGKTIVNLSDGG